MKICMFICEKIRNVRLSTLVVFISLMFTVGTSHAGWSFASTGDTTGTLSDGNWVLYVSFTQEEPNRLFVYERKQGIGTNESDLDLSALIDGSTAKKIVSVVGFWGVPIKQLTLPNSLEIIKANAFYGCNVLTNITPFLPHSVTNIGTEAFRACNALGGKLVLSNPELLEIGNSTFNSYSPSRFTSVNMVDMSGSGIKRIGQYAFNWATNLENVVLSGCLESIEENAFINCSSLTNVMPFFPQSVTNIEAYAFKSTAVYGDVVLSNPNLTGLGKEAFNGYPNMKITSVDMSGSGIKRLSGWLFNFNKSLRSVVLSDKLEIIEGYAFADCNNLENITPFLPSSVTNIMENAFNGCSGVTNALVLNGKRPITIGNYGLRQIKAPSVYFGENVNDLSAIDIFHNTSTIKQIWFCGDMPTLGNRLFEECNTAQLGMRFYIPKNNSTWTNYVNSVIEPLDSNEKADFISKYPEEPALPIGKFYPPGKQRYQYLCTWRPSINDNLITVMIVK